MAAILCDSTVVVVVVVRTHALTSNTDCHDNHEKINSWVPCTFLGMGMVLRYNRNADVVVCKNLKNISQKNM